MEVPSSCIRGVGGEELNQEYIMNELLKNRYSKWMSILELMSKDECLD